MPALAPSLHCCRAWQSDRHRNLALAVRERRPNAFSERNMVSLFTPTPAACQLLITYQSPASGPRSSSTASDSSSLSGDLRKDHSSWFLDAHASARWSQASRLHQYARCGSADLLIIAGPERRHDRAYDGHEATRLSGSTRPVRAKPPDERRRPLIRPGAISDARFSRSHAGSSVRTTVLRRCPSDLAPLIRRPPTPKGCPT